MDLIVSADDFGASRGVTDTILEAVDHGAVNSVSVLPNGVAFDYAIEAYRRRPGLRLSAHLNFVEGAPLSPAESVPDLVGDDGRFAHSFVSLWLRAVRAGAESRAALRGQLLLEASAQLERVRSALAPGQELHVDSHVHLHLIPFVLDALLELHERESFAYVRMLEEPFLRVRREGALANYLGPNLLKHLLLNRLSLRAKRLLRARGIPHCNTFVGVLFTGNMSGEVVRAALERPETSLGDGEVVEVLFHPGGAAAGEEDVWSSRENDIRAHYFSPSRRREREALEDPELRELLVSYSGGAGA